MAKRQSVARHPETEETDGPSSRDARHDYASFLKNSESERRLLSERIAEADKGVFISSEAMHRWVESWGTENELPPPEPDVFLKPRRT
jgi:predicted transcriptional regulator